MFDRMEAEEIGLAQIEDRAETMLRGQIRGRVLIDPNR